MSYYQNNVVRHCLQDTLEFFLVGSHSIQDWTITKRHGVTKKGKDEKHIGKIISKDQKITGSYQL